MAKYTIMVAPGSTIISRPIKSFKTSSAAQKYRTKKYREGFKGRIRIKTSSGYGFIGMNTYNK